MKDLFIILRIVAILLYMFTIGAGLIALELCVERDGGEPWINQLWIGSGILSLFLAFCAEKLDSRNRRRSSAHQGCSTLSI